MTRLVTVSRIARSSRWAGLVAGLAVAVVAGPSLSGAEAKQAAKQPAKQPEQAKTNAAPKVVVIPKSVFTDDIKVGKDPFFPNSLRRNPPPPTPPKQPDTAKQADKPAGPPPPPPPPPDPFKDFSLRGISGTATRKFATINTKVKSYVFRNGERLEVKTPEGSVFLRCVAIKDESVVISVEGKPGQKELLLRSGP
ncbi:MAG: hypothetical protein HYZ36_01910 [Pedosphaera parvula]|nr:hypothetical protein [Pedosphaera parvula]